MSYQRGNCNFLGYQLHKEKFQYVSLPEIFCGKNTLSLFGEKHTLSQRAQISQGKNQQENGLGH